MALCSPCVYAVWDYDYGNCSLNAPKVKLEIGWKEAEKNLLEALLVQKKWTFRTVSGFFNFGWTRRRRRRISEIDMEDVI